MAKRPQAQDLIAAYELGLLDHADRARFEAATLDDTELLDDLYDAATETQVLMQDPGRFAAAARAGLAAGERGARESLLDRLQNFFRPRVLVPVAAVLALAFVIFGPGQDTGHLADLAVLEPIPATRQVVRADAPDAETRFREAINTYLDARWDDAAARFEEAIGAGGDNWPRQAQARLYLGSSLLLAGKTRLAARELEIAATASLLPIREQATWQLAHARLALDDAAGARTALESLRSSPVLAEQALALLTRLDARD